MFVLLNQISQMRIKGFTEGIATRSSQDSLGIAYTDHDKQVKIVRPDFVFFSTQADGTVAAHIVDPHGTQFSDAIP